MEHNHVIIDGGPGKGYKNLIQAGRGPHEPQNSKDTMMLSLSHDQKDQSINPDTLRVSDLSLVNLFSCVLFLQGMAVSV
jgi:hypothetical protein